MLKFSNQDCKFFGTMTEEKKGSRQRCTWCKANNPDMHFECVTSYRELSEYIESIDKKDVAMTKMCRLVTKTEEGPPTRRVKRVQESKMTNETPIQPIQSTTPKIKSTSGVLAIAKSMLVDGKPIEQIMSALITEYQRAGKTAKQAKHNAQSCLFNARKKLKNETAVTPGPTSGTVQQTNVGEPVTFMGIPLPVVNEFENLVKDDIAPEVNMEEDEVTEETEQQDEDGYTDESGDLINDMG
jgi:hypothetical protein